MFGCTAANVNRRQARPDCSHERGGGIDRRDRVGAQPVHQLRRQGSRPASHIQRPLTLSHTGPLHELHGQRLGEPAHEPRVGIRRDIEAHHSNVRLRDRRARADQLLSQGARTVSPHNIRTCRGARDRSPAGTTACIPATRRTQGSTRPHRLARRNVLSCRGARGRPTSGRATLSRRVFRGCRRGGQAPCSPVPRCASATLSCGEDASVWATTQYRSVSRSKVSSW